MKLGDIDIQNPDNYLQGPPYEMFRALREQAPVYKHPHPDGGHFWAISRFADVVAVSRDHKTFSAQRGFVLMDELEPDLLSETQGQLLGMDPPNHGPIRRAVINHFTTDMVDGMEPRIRAMACEILDEAAERGECNFVDDITAKLPTRVICEMMGIERQHWDQVRHWADLQTAADDPDIAGSPEEVRQASRDMGAFGYQLACERRTQGLKGDEDLMIMLLNSEVDGRNVDPQQFASLFLQITTAGNETTRNLMANGMRDLVRHPDAYKELERDPGSLDTAVAEMLRYSSPLNYFRRTATCDTTLRDQEIKEGDRVVMFYVSANRDEDEFPDADAFDIHRQPNNHLAFGHGIHLCLGLHLAQLETRLFFEEFFKRFREIEVLDDCRQIRSNLNNGMKKMPVRLHPR